MEKKETMEYLPVEEVKTQGRFIKAIGFKPKTAPVVVAAMGFALLIPDSLYSRLLGFLMIALAAAVFLKVKDYKVMDIFDQGIMFYEGTDAKHALFLPFGDISVWRTNSKDGQDFLEFELNDGSKIVKSTFETGKAYRTLYPLINEKEYNHIRIKQNKESQPSIPEAIHSIKDRFLKK